VGSALVEDFNPAADPLTGYSEPTVHKESASVVRVDAISCLLQRRESRNTHDSCWRGIKVDGSPKLHCEILGCEMETMPDKTPATVHIEKLPGATLVHGAQKICHKLFVFLWGLWLVFGPSHLQMRAALNSIMYMLEVP